MLVRAARLQRQRVVQLPGRFKLAVGVAVDDLVLLHVQPLQRPVVRIGQVFAIGVEGSLGPRVVAEGHVLGLHKDLIEHRLGEVGLFEAGERVDRQPVGRLPLGIGDRLVEVGVVLDDVVLGTLVDAREARRAQGVGVVDHRALDDLRAVDRRAGQRIGTGAGDCIAVAVIPQPAVEQVDIDLESVARMILERGRHAQSATIRVPARRRLGGRLPNARQEVRPRGGINARGDVLRRIFGEAPAPVAVAIFVVSDVAVRDREQCTEIAPAFGHQAHQARRHAAGVGVGLPLGRHHELGTVIVERLGGGELHRAGDAAFVLLGRIGLLHGDAAEQL